MLRELERVLIARLARARLVRRHRAVRRALLVFHTDPGAVRVAEVVDELGLSARRFITLFEEEVGLTPKRYLRVQRFQRAVQRLHAEAGGGDLVELALACGYSDQAHFNHDFREFAGTTPRAYVAARGSHPNHVTWRASPDA